MLLPTLIWSVQSPVPCPGAIGGLSFYAWSCTLHKLGVDDAIDAVGVHLGGGIWVSFDTPLQAPCKPGPVSAADVGLVSACGAVAHNCHIDDH